MTNSAEPDQLASSEANWSGSTLFAKAGYIRVQQDKGFKRKAYAYFESEFFPRKVFRKGVYFKANSFLKKIDTFSKGRQTILT